MNIILAIGSAFGLLSMIIAAYIDHSLALTLSGKPLKSILTAVKYHQFYSMLICALGLTLTLKPNGIIKAWLIRSGYIFVAGIFLFSFSIYLSLLLKINAITYFTPIGGILLMVGWAFLTQVIFHYQ